MPAGISRLPWTRDDEQEAYHGAGSMAYYPHSLGQVFSIAAQTTPPPGSPPSGGSISALQGCLPIFQPQDTLYQACPYR